MEYFREDQIKEGIGTTTTELQEIKCDSVEWSHLAQDPVDW
jgi:hypothetical protein